MRIRPARGDDYETFARLFLELESGDPVPERSQFVEEIAPGTLVAEDAGALGYAYGHLHDGVLHVRHLVTAPEARRRGVGRALLRAHARARDRRARVVLEREARQRRCPRALRERTPLDRVGVVGRSLRRRRARPHRAACRRAAPRARAPRGGRRGRARRRAPRRAARARPSAQARAARARRRRRARGRRGARRALPGCISLPLGRPELAGPFVGLLADRAARDHLFVTAEDQPEVATALAAAGGTLRFELFHMRGELR